MSALSGLFTLHRNYTHMSLSGHSINFKKNEPVYVPPACRKEVMAFGAIPAEGDVDILGPEEVEVVPLTADEREAALLDAFNVLLGRNNRTDFTGQGVPSIKAIGDLVEFDVDRKEIERVWRAEQARVGAGQ